MQSGARAVPEHSRRVPVRGQALLQWAEICVVHRGCIAGPVVACDDGSACTIDRCVEDTQSCVHAPRDTDARTIRARPRCSGGGLRDGLRCRGPGRRARHRLAIAVPIAKEVRLRAVSHDPGGEIAVALGPTCGSTTTCGHVATSNEARAVARNVSGTVYAVVTTRAETDVDVIRRRPRPRTRPAPPRRRSHPIRRSVSISGPAKRRSCLTERVPTARRKKPAKKRSAKRGGTR